MKAEEAHKLILEQNRKDVYQQELFDVDEILDMDTDG